jgi:hypothetical protein
LLDCRLPIAALALAAARLQRRPVVIMAHKCASVEEWLERYGQLALR